MIADIAPAMFFPRRNQSVTEEKTGAVITELESFREFHYFFLHG